MFVDYYFHDGLESSDCEGENHRIHREWGVENYLKKIDPTKLSSIRIIIESIRRTAEYASDIAEIVLNLNVNQIIET